MLDPKGFVCDGFQNNGPLLVLVLELANPSNMTIFSNPIHTIYGHKHAKKSPFYIDAHLAYQIISGRLSQVRDLEHSPNCFDIPLHALHGSGFAHSTIFVYCIRRHTIRQDMKCNYALLDTGQAQNSRRIALLKKIWIILTDSLDT
jgi:hypothetical protein